FTFWRPPLPLQALLPLQTGLLLGSGFPAVMLVQVPLPERLHAWHVPHAADAQQTPPTQLPPAQSDVPFVHVCPFTLWQAPLPLQALLPLQTGLLLRSVFPATMLVQVPLPERLHAWHVPHAAEPQQTPSTQLPLAQSDVPVAHLPL